MTRSSAAGRSNAGHDLFTGGEKKKNIKENKKATPTSIQVGEHGRYQIKSGRLEGKYVARAFAKPPTKARGMIAARPEVAHITTAEYPTPAARPANSALDCSKFETTFGLETHDWRASLGRTLDRLAQEGAR